LIITIVNKDTNKNNFVDLNAHLGGTIDSVLEDDLSYPIISYHNFLNDQFAKFLIKQNFNFCVFHPSSHRWLAVTDQYPESCSVWCGV